jgi:DUF4097 and DUF4098 domain-containing protein YvlB
MRRSSLVGPLLLIAIGGLLLAHNIYPDLRAIDWVASYWPYVLIAWGGLRVLEILFWAARSKPLPSRGLTGGEVALAIFIALFGNSVHTARSYTNGFTTFPGNIDLGGIELFGQRFDYPVDEERATSKTPRVILEAFRGDVQISGSDTDRVKVSGQVTVRAMDQAAADAVHRDAPLEVTGDSGRVVIRMKRDVFGPMRATAAIEVVVPKGSRIEFEGRSGDLRVAGVDGSVELQGRGSDVELQDLGGQVAIDGTFNGVIQLQRLSKPLHMQLPRTELSVERIPGELRMALGDLHATNVVGPFHLNTRAHDVRIEDFTNSVDLSVERGDLELRPGRLPLSRIQAHSRSGDIRVSLPDGAQFSINAATVNGNITNDFSSQLKLDSNRRHSTLTGSIGSGPAIELETQRGDIEIRKAGSEPKSQMVNHPPERIEQKIERKIEQNVQQKIQQLQKLDQ